MVNICNSWMNMKIHNRKRRKEKADKDAETMMQLWVVRIQELIAEGNTPKRALSKLSGEVHCRIMEDPQRSSQIKGVWNQFLRKIP